MAGYAPNVWNPNKKNFLFFLSRPCLICLRRPCFCGSNQTYRATFTERTAFVLTVYLDTRLAQPLRIVQTKTERFVKMCSSPIVKNTRIFRPSFDGGVAAGVLPIRRRTSIELINVRRNSMKKRFGFDKWIKLCTR